MVHRPFRLAEILHDMVEAKLQPKADADLSIQRKTKNQTWY